MSVAPFYHGGGVLSSDFLIFFDFTLSYLTEDVKCLGKGMLARQVNPRCPLEGKVPARNERGIGVFFRCRVVSHPLSRCATAPPQGGRQGSFSAFLAIRLPKVCGAFAFPCSFAWTLAFSFSFSFTFSCSFTFSLGYPKKNHWFCKEDKSHGLSRLPRGRKEGAFSLRSPRSVYFYFTTLFSFLRP